MKKMLRRILSFIMLVCMAFMGVFTMPMVSASAAGTSSEMVVSAKSGSSSERESSAGAGISAGMLSSSEMGSGAGAAGSKVSSSMTGSSFRGSICSGISGKCSGREFSGSRGGKFGLSIVYPPDSAEHNLLSNPVSLGLTLQCGDQSQTKGNGTAC